jgi:hypothetical protein
MTQAGASPWLSNTLRGTQNNPQMAAAMATMISGGTVLFDVLEFNRLSICNAYVIAWDLVTLTSL